MKHHLIKAALAATLLVAVSCQQKSDPTGFKLNTEEQKTFYAMGLMLGQNLARLDLTDDELSSLYKGLYTAAKGQKGEVEWMTYQPKIQEVFQKRMEQASVKQKDQGKAYLEKFIKDEGATKTASGLAYKVIKEGTGALPKSTDEVEVHYHGTLIDGTVFDSSVDRKQTVSFPLDRVIKGWTEGLQLVKEGGKIKLVIPSELAYADAGAPPNIPGGATLTFDVELIKIKKPEDKKKEAIANTANAAKAAAETSKKAPAKATN